VYLRQKTWLEKVSESKFFVISYREQKISLNLETKAGNDLRTLIINPETKRNVNKSNGIQSSIEKS
jgi:hypothetical protein